MSNTIENRLTAVPEYPVYPQGVPQKCLETKKYVVRFARNRAELLDVQKLRSVVFYQNPNGIDKDRFDEVCHHLLVLDKETNAVVGTYRMQTYDVAKQYYGFYSDSEYVLSDFPQDVIQNAVEIGRVCVEESHRNGRVLHLLWRGLAMYLQWNHKRYLFGCSSLFSQDPKEGYATLEYFRREGKVHDAIWVNTREAYACEYEGSLEGIEANVPKILKVYMTLGAKVCSPPALDRDFKSIDYLTLFDLEGLSERAYTSFFGE